MINCECNPKIFSEFEIKVKQDLSFLRFLNIKIKECQKEDSFLSETKQN